MNERAFFGTSGTALKVFASFLDSVWKSLTEFFQLWVSHIRANGHPFSVARIATKDFQQRFWVAYVSRFMFHSFKEIK